MLQAPPELTDHLVRISGLEYPRAERLLREILEYFDEDIDAFVRRRHRELQRSGRRNDAIWPRLVAEVEGRPFRASALTERQLRRIVYG